MAYVLVFRFGDRAVDEVRSGSGNEHGNAHHENPDQQLDLYGWTFDAEQNERNQSNAGDTVGFESVGGGPHGIARIISGAIRNDARIARVVFLNLEDDLHQVGANIGDFGEDSACDSQGG